MKRKKIMHLCLAGCYNDGYEYQENLFTRIHKAMGYEVLVVTSTEVFIDKVNIGHVEPCDYVNDEGIEVHRLPYWSWIPKRLVYKLRLFKNVLKELNGFKPDIIFLHDCQFLSIIEVAKFLKANSNVKVYADSHTDFRNSARNFLSKYILHGIIYKYCVHIIEPFTIRFYGTLPSRVDFYTDFYGTPKNKTEFLPMGADDSYVQKAKLTNQRSLIRNKYGISDDEILIVTGGKLNNDKREILNAVEAVKELSKTNKVRMLVFGSIQEGEFANDFNFLCDNHIIQHIGWVKGHEAYNVFEAADLIIFSGSHSVLWEQAVGQGKPCVFKYMEGFTHCDLGGNCAFVRNYTTEEVTATLQKCIDNYDEMEKVAREKGLQYFSYYKIAERALLPVLNNTSEDCETHSNP